jgi:hypothetical protein
MEIDRQFIIVQSAYNNRPMSAYRLAVTEEICLPSLAAQHESVELIVSLCADDPHLERRKQSYMDCREKVHFVYREPEHMPVELGSIAGREDWGVPVGPRVIVTRIDDDDALASDYSSITRDVASTIEDETVILLWPNGYLRQYGGRLQRMRHPGNQFISLVTSSGKTPHDHNHLEYPGLFPTVTVCTSRGWLWNRHGMTITPTARKWKRGAFAHPPNTSRWAIPMG